MRTEKEFKQNIGARLREVRGTRDQRTFAEAVGSVQQTLSKYERGEVPRSWFFLARLAEENVDLNELLTGKRSPRPVGFGDDPRSTWVGGREF